MHKKEHEKKEEKAVKKWPKIIRRGVDNCPLNIVSSLLLLKVVASVSKYGGKLESDPQKDPFVYI